MSEAVFQNIRKLYSGEKDVAIRSGNYMISTCRLTRFSCFLSLCIRSGPLSGIDEISTYGPFSNRFDPSTRIRYIVLKTLKSRIAHVQRIRILKSPRKTRHHSKERKIRGFVFTLSYYKFSPF